MSVSDLLASTLTGVKPWTNLSVNSITSPTTSAGALTCTSLVSSGSVGCTSLTSSGSISCASLTSTGDIIQPRYELKMYLSANQQVVNSVSTPVSLTAVDTASGGNVNWTTVTTPTSTYTIPVAGTYLVNLTVVFATATGDRSAWCEVNNGSVPDSKRRWGESSVAASAATATGISSVFQYRFAANDTVQAICSQNSAAPINIIGGGANQACFLQITRLSA